ncbi:MAG: alanine racemase [Microbacterium sp.]
MPHTDRAVHEAETPFAVIDDARLRSNSTVMHAWIAAQGAILYPHAKTVMSPELVRLQLDDGSEGMTVATVAQVRALRAWGVQRILLANQLVQPEPAREFAAELKADPTLQLWSFVDSPEGIEVLQAAAAAEQIVFDVLVEAGAPGRRSGIRSREQLAELTAAATRSPGVRIIGVAAYEGAMGADRGEKSMAAVDAYLQHAVAFLTALIDDGTIAEDEAVFSAGGSMFFDRVTEAVAPLPRARVVIRSGCYLLHDHGLYRDSTPLPGDDEAPGLQPALTVWGTVHSRPEAGRAYVDVGRRDVSYDQGLPVVLRRIRRGESVPELIENVQVLSLNDHHTHLGLPADSDLAIGDRVEFGISHPCTTMDKWRTIPLADPSGSFIGQVHTEF